MIERIIANFGSNVTIEGTTIKAIFRQSSKAIDENGILVTVRRPRITFKLSDFPSVAKEQTVVIGSQSYVIKQLEHDDEGSVTCHLFKSGN
jgi:hypothetical protein